MAADETVNSDLAAQIAECSEAISKNPRDGKAYRQRGLLKARMRRYDEALHDFERTLKLAPNDAHASVRARADELQITRLELDGLSKMQDGYSSKILGPSRIKTLGTKSLGGILGGTGTYLILVEDAEATAKIMARAKKRRLPLRQIETEKP